GIDTVWPHRFAGHGREVVREDFTSGAVDLAAGDEMGRFYLGSTVVLLFEPGRVAWLEGLKPGDPVRMGQAIGDCQEFKPKFDEPDSSHFG
ncbi:MAG: phosphatidylserine decarboxylase, partial [Alphaproteobacteria bacterium]|nr:phosphatidylserine decarboxylase [Alphaproteobacteria bacterium]